MNFITLSGDKETRLKTAIEHIEKLKANRMNFTEKDLEQLDKKGISKDKVLGQIETFKEGIPECLLFLADEWQYLQSTLFSPA